MTSACCRTLSATAKTALLLLSTLAMPIAACAEAEASEAPAAEWTVMVYMNAKNNLEEAGIDDFLEMAKVGSTPAVNIVTQFGRPKAHYTQAYGPWSGVKRYRIEKDLEPHANIALLTLADQSPESDMGDPRSLVSFVTWARQKYPAKKYMLIIWNHGQGWRLQLTAGKKEAEINKLSFARSKVIGGVRSVSHDADTGNILYNRQIQDSLGTALGGQKLDIIAFDACLMAMVETAYAMRELAPVLVASQELEPGAGWQYDTWLQEAVKNPQASARELSQMAVQSYRQHYRDTYLTTLSAVDLTRVTSMSQSISSLAKAVQKAGTQGAIRASAARTGIQSYGDGQTQPNYIDIGLMLDRFIAGGANDEIGKAAAQAKAELTQMVIANYRSSRLDEGFGSHGLSIFFPESAQTLRADPDGTGYSRANTQWPVQFVQDFQWSCFLMKHLLGANAGQAAQGCQ